MKGTFVQNYFLHGLEIENDNRLKMYMKLVKRKIIFVYGVSLMKSSYSMYFCWFTASPPTLK